MAQNKPSRWSRRTGTTIKKVVLKSKHADLKAAQSISKQAKNASPRLKKKIEEDSLDGLLMIPELGHMLIKKS